VQYPSDTQSALLFDRPFTHLEAVATKAVAVLSARFGAEFKCIEANPGVFYRIFGGDDLMITLEYMDGQANVALFDLPLKSPITNMLCSEMGERVAGHRSHVLIGVSHGVFGNSPEVAALLDKMSYPKTGATYAHFEQRLIVCELLTLIAQETLQASAIHWTQSDQLFDYKTFETYANGTAPSLLHVHPYLLGGGTSDEGDPLVTVVGLGSAQFVGRTVTVKANPLPWHVSFEAIFIFLRVALAKGGYIIPDIDTFGDEDNTQSYRVRHMPAQEGLAAFYELEPLLHKEHGYQSPTYVVPSDTRFDDRNMPKDLLPNDASDRAQVLEELRSKRALAEGIGGRFDVRRVVGGRMVPSPEPTRGPGLLSRIAGFGRKTQRR
jgi:hypothetical protein